MGWEGLRGWPLNCVGGDAKARRRFSPAYAPVITRAFDDVALAYTYHDGGRRWIDGRISCETQFWRLLVDAIDSIYRTGSEQGCA